jgi:hypothetical protein
MTPSLRTFAAEAQLVSGPHVANNTGKAITQILDLTI